ncbi:MAG: hypothetical protein L0177_10805 [Chloroflexi bacterium]|nr:hypothetical protein [Chloroflexota bacterium]
MTHSGEATVQLSVLGEDTSGDGLKLLCWLRQEVAYRCGSKVVHRDLQPLGNFGQPALSVVGQVEGYGHVPKVRWSVRESHVRQSNEVVGKPWVMLACRRQRRNASGVVGRGNIASAAT